MPKLTERKRKSLIKDESMASKEYDKLGFHNIAKDERKHKRILQKKQIKKWKTKQRKLRKHGYNYIKNANFLIS